MSRHELPELPEDALRDHGSAQRVDRVWRRLEADLGTSRGPGFQLLVWVPAALAIAFGCGLAVGARWFHAESNLASTLSPEPAGAPEQIAARQAPARASAEDAGSARTERQPPRPRVTAPPVEPPVAVIEPAPPVPPPAPVSPPEWAELASAGEFKAAREKLDAQGGFDAAIERASAEQLMTLVDIARFAGERERALAALRRVVERHRRDPNAPLAAWTLANMLEKAGDRDGAAKAYAEYRHLSPQGDFAEDALAQEVAVAVERGDDALARKLAAQHEKDFPSGRRRADITEQLAKLGGADGGTIESDAAAAGSTGSDDTPPEEPAP